MDGMLIKSADIACVRSLSERSQILVGSSVIATSLFVYAVRSMTTDIAAAIIAGAASAVPDVFPRIGNRLCGVQPINFENGENRSISASLFR